MKPIGAVTGRDEPALGSETLLEVRSIAKSFAGVTVLRDVSLAVRAGEVVMLVGENGAGKSTLKNILSGLIEPDAGEILFRGQHYRSLSAGEADRLGIGTIHQELSLFDNLSVAENIHLPHLPHRGGFLRQGAMREQARTLLRDVIGAEIDPDAEVESLSLGERQLVELAKSVHHASSILILDEPTTCLSLPERRRLFEVVRRLKGQGYGLIYITHFMEEVYELGDRIVVLRDGALVADGTPAEIPLPQLARLMVGREIEELSLSPPPLPRDAPIILSVRDLSDAELVHEVGFDLHAGEILGLAGLVGAGRSEVAELLVGLRRGSGDVTLGGQPFERRSPREAMVRGMVLVSEDRRRDQAFLARSVRENLTAPSLPALCDGPLGSLALSREVERAYGLCEAFGVNHPGLEAPIVTLSGGNQQKAILGRWFQGDPRVCILDEPTKGVDIGARAALHRLILAKAAQGVGVLLISSDLPELLGLAHRVLVLHKGRLAAEVGRDAATPQHVMALASTGRAA
jgi:ribose transport system ATP-binding protein